MDFQGFQRYNRVLLICSWFADYFVMNRIERKNFGALRRFEKPTAGSNLNPVMVLTCPPLVRGHNS